MPAIAETIDCCCARWSLKAEDRRIAPTPTASGEEGRFYVWTLVEIEEVLGAADARIFAETYGRSGISRRKL